jgi:hypothetical protein
MTILVTLKPEVAGYAIDWISNCGSGSEEGLVINLHADFPIPEDQLHQDGVFPWMEHVQDIGNIQQALLPDFRGFGSLEELLRIT